MEPDFKSLAENWVANDPRMREVDSDRRESLVSRIAEALSRRRDHQTEAEKDIGLVVNVDRDHFQPGRGLSEEALDQLAEMVQERIEHDNGV